MRDNPQSADPVALARELVRCPSVTPREGGALATLEEVLAGAGFEVHRLTFRHDDTPDVENLFARFGSGSPHLMYAGHTDVVPPGEVTDWRFDPFAGTIEDGVLFGRGAVDMKGSIACFVAAALDHVRAWENQNSGTLSLLITGDEEGPAINGTRKILDWAVARGEKFDACIVGEPTNPRQLGDMIKIGRRGSLSAELTVKGTQGHVAYPHLADNPITGLLRLIGALTGSPLDTGTADFQPSNLEITTVDVGNQALNVIPAKASAKFNIRFNDSWSRDALEGELRRRLDKAAGNAVNFILDIHPGNSDAFLTRSEPLIAAMSGAIEAITGRIPELSTNGGTSDARFIKDVCPVIEFGLVGQTMHQVDERVALTDLNSLRDIYARFLADYFAGQR
jgi:succinyl-diaminopimelate desuccinylase